MSEWPEKERYFYSNFSLRLDEREWKIICDQEEPAPERSRERERERDVQERWLPSTRKLLKIVAYHNLILFRRQNAVINGRQIYVFFKGRQLFF
jgi:hypothetical protein